MAMYLTSFRQSAETWARLLAKPEDRRETLGPVMEAAGGKLHGYWYAFGAVDGYVLFEAPDDATAAGILVRVSASGAFVSVETTKLMTVEEALPAFGKVASIGYRAPGASE